MTTRSEQTAELSAHPFNTANTVYERPRIECLGTLAELTLGGDTGSDDGTGGAGDNGVFSA